MAVLYGVSLLLGLGAPLFDTASTAVLPRLVGTVALDRANSWNQTSLLLGATLIGPPLGAALFVLGPGVPLAAQAASFLVAAALVATLGCIRTGPTATPAERSLRRELVDGLRYLVGHRLLRTLALPLAAINAASSCVYAAAASLLRLTLNATGLTAPARRPVRPHPSLAPQVETASSPSSDHSVPGTLALTIRGVSAR